MPLFETVTSLSHGSDVLRRRAYGVIEVVEGQFSRVLLRPFPKLVSVPEILLLGRFNHDRRQGDRCLLYYNRPLRHRNYLVLKYVVSTRGTRMATINRSLDVLTEIARLKGSDAILTEVANWRISRRALSRYGYEPHCPSRWHRHYIQRFYGEYPTLRVESLQRRR